MKTLRLMILLAVVFFTLTINAQTREQDKAKADITELLKNKIVFYDSDKYPSFSSHLVPNNILVLEDRIELTIRKTIRTVYFADELNYAPGSNRVMLGNTLFLEKKSGNALKLAEDIIIIQNQLNEKKYSSQLILFEPIAAQYRALKVKPKVSEGQREFIVQANSFNEQMNYSKAIEFYNKAIESDQTAYPAAYSNLALLSAQINKFDAAIYYMKKYLLLEPEAADARSAQDKIYEWTARITI
jgi:tetratricopeptide (TPR) repeat protein